MAATEPLKMIVTHNDGWISILFYEIVDGTPVRHTYNIPMQDTPVETNVSTVLEFV